MLLKLIYYTFFVLDNIIFTFAALLLFDCPFAPVNFFLKEFGVVDAFFIYHNQLTKDKITSMNMTSIGIRISSSLKLTCYWIDTKFPSAAHPVPGSILSLVVKTHLDT